MHTKDHIKFAFIWICFFVLAALLISLLGEYFYLLGIVGLAIFIYNIFSSRGSDVDDSIPEQDDQDF